MSDSKTTSESKTTKWVTRFVLMPIIVALIGVSSLALANKINIRNQTTITEIESYFVTYIDFENGIKIIQKEEIVIETISQRIGHAVQFTGFIKSDINNVHPSRTWKITGYIASEYISFTYVSDGQDKSYGIGVVFAKKANNLWKGTWLGRETDHYDRVITCPYIISEQELTKKQIDELESFKDLPIYDVNTKEKLKISPFPSSNNTL